MRKISLLQIDNLYSAKLIKLAVAEWRLRQQSTFWGFLWTLLNPALLFVVLYGLFIKWLGKFQPDYAVFLLIGIIQWNYFASATSYGLGAMIRKSHILKNYPLRPELPVFAAVLSAAVSHLLELAALSVFLMFYTKTISLAWLALFPLELSFLALICGLALGLSRFMVFYADTERIWGILLTAGFFLTPVFYPLNIVAGGKHAILVLNPVARIISAARLIMTGNGPVPAADWLYIFSFSAAVLAAGLIFARSDEGKVADAI
ncbi:MAG: hypothetical protein A2270_07655 [Elusimicrobia bacterium RIFOXYA12_FULL_51_18]|nr:MAG: hypothetical protein A2270_07655 [Elusimicrobia bacterium RIFOXYA12_FULL_51_18]OGS29940.1 MAG: hypothetical protein A2218_12325 [Elusimicrobia bacterium RIFOXYA2_FULL_53_38]